MPKMTRRIDIFDDLVLNVIWRVCNGLESSELARVLDALHTAYCNSDASVGTVSPRTVLRQRREMNEIYEYAMNHVGPRWMRQRADTGDPWAFGVLVRHLGSGGEQYVTWHMYFLRWQRRYGGTIVTRDHSAIASAYRELMKQARDVTLVLRCHRSSPLYHRIMSRETFCSALLARACVYHNADANVTLELRPEQLFRAYDWAITIYAVAAGSACVSRF